MKLSNREFFFKLLRTIFKLSTRPFRIVVDRFLGLFNLSIKDFKSYLVRFFFDDNYLISSILLKSVKRPDIRMDFKDTIIIGPWFSEVGFELIYWIPFLKRIQGIRDKNIIVISRGGVSSWYKVLKSKSFKYYNIDQFISKNELSDYKKNKIKYGQKQLYVEDIEKKIYDKLIQLNNLNIDNVTFFHPKIMYSHFRSYWARGYYHINKGIKLSLEKNIRFKDLIYKKNHIPFKQNKNFVVVKLYESSILSLDKDKIFYLNKINSILEEINKKYSLFFLNYENKDDHMPIVFKKIYNDKKNYRLNDYIFEKNNNLEIQTLILKKAKFFIGTYGGFSYLPSFLNLNAIALANSNFKLIKRHTPIYEYIQNKTKFALVDLNNDNFIIKKTIKKIFKIDKKY